HEPPIWQRGSAGVAGNNAPDRRAPAGGFLRQCLRGAASWRADAHHARIRARGDSCDRARAQRYGFSGQDGKDVAGGTEFYRFRLMNHGEHGEHREREKTATDASPWESALATGSALAIQTPPDGLASVAAPRI